MPKKGPIKSLEEKYRRSFVGSPSKLHFVKMIGQRARGGSIPPIGLADVTFHAANQQIVQEMPMVLYPDTVRLVIMDNFWVILTKKIVPSAVPSNDGKRYFLPGGVVPEGKTARQFLSEEVERLSGVMVDPGNIKWYRAVPLCPELTPAVVEYYYLVVDDSVPYDQDFVPKVDSGMAIKHDGVGRCMAGRAHDKLDFISATIVGDIRKELNR